MDLGVVASAAPIALLTLREAAAYLRCSPSKLYSTAWRRRNRIPPPIKIGRLARWRLEDLDARCRERGAVTLPYAHRHVCPHCGAERSCEAMHCAEPDQRRKGCWPCHERGHE